MGQEPSCAFCGEDMSKSPSDYWCSSSCQAFWNAGLGDPLVPKPQAPSADGHAGYMGYAAAYGLWGAARAQANTPTEEAA